MKIKVIAIITVFIILLTYVPVYAETTIPDPPYGAYNFWVVVGIGNPNRIYLITSPNPTRAPNNGKQIYATGYKEYYLSDGYWSYDTEGLSNISVPINHIYASNHDIAYADGSGFFFTLPKVSELYQAVQQAKNRGDFGILLRTILAGLIPLVGLLILGISFRKGWAFLRRQLTH